MIVAAWRIVPARRRGDAFSGEGARLFGGRWNSPGFPVVYCSSSKALAALETLVHLNPHQPISYVVFRADLDAELIEDQSGATFPAGWDAEPPGPASMRFGNNWIKGARSAVLAVPSVLTREPNYLLNPRHKHFPRIRIDAGQPFAFDPRVLPGIQR